MTFHTNDSSSTIILTSTTNCPDFTTSLQSNLNQNVPIVPRSPGAQTLKALLQILRYFSFLGFLDLDTTEGEKHSRFSLHSFKIQPEVKWHRLTRGQGLCLYLLPTQFSPAPQRVTYAHSRTEVNTTPNQKPRRPARPPSYSPAEAAAADKMAPERSRPTPLREADVPESPSRRR